MGQAAAVALLFTCERACSAARLWNDHSLEVEVPGLFVGRLARLHTLACTRVPFGEWGASSWSQTAVRDGIGASVQLF